MKPLTESEKEQCLNVMKELTILLEKATQQQDKMTMKEQIDLFKETTYLIGTIKENAAMTQKKP